MPSSAPSAYSRTQIALHWTIAVLILAQYLFSEGIERAWRAFVRGQDASASDLPLAYMHATFGLTILALAALRLWLRASRGVPPLPADDPAPLKLLAHVTHGLIYLLIFIVPFSGAVAWFFGVQGAIAAHLLGKTVLMYVVGLHIAGALVQHFVFRTNVLRRMIAFGRA